MPWIRFVWLEVFGCDLKVLVVLLYLDYPVCKKNSLFDTKAQIDEGSFDIFVLYILVTTLYHLQRCRNREERSFIATWVSNGATVEVIKVLPTNIL